MLDWTHFNKIHFSLTLWTFALQYIEWKCCVTRDTWIQHKMCVCWFGYTTVIQITLTINNEARNFYNLLNCCDIIYSFLFVCVVLMADDTSNLGGCSQDDKLRLAASKGQVERIPTLLAQGAGFQPDKVHFWLDIRDISIMSSLFVCECKE